MWCAVHVVGCTCVCAPCCARSEFQTGPARKKKENRIPWNGVRWAARRTDATSRRRAQQESGCVRARAGRSARGSVRTSVRASVSARAGECMRLHAPSRTFSPVLMNESSVRLGQTARPLRSVTCVPCTYQVNLHLGDADSLDNADPMGACAAPRRAAHLELLEGSWALGAGELDEQLLPK